MMQTRKNTMSVAQMKSPWLFIPIPDVLHFFSHPHSAEGRSMDYFPTTSLFPFIDQPLHFTIEFFDFAYTPNPGPDCATTFFLNHKGRNMRGTAECRGACQWMHLQLHDVDDLNTMLHACAMGYHPQSSIGRTCTAVRRLISSHGIHSQAMFTVSCNADVHTECLK